MKTALNLLISFFILASCSHHSAQEETNVQVAKGLKGHRYSDIYFSSQPSENSLKDLKNNGFVAVINLREKKEGKYQESWESKIVKAEGLNYYNVPFSMKDDMSDEYVKKVTSKIHLHRRDGKILVHCRTGNKVGIWLGAHFHKDHAYSKTDARGMARKLGLTNKKAMAKLNTYLKGK